MKKLVTLLIVLTGSVLAQSASPVLPPPVAPSACLWPPWVTQGVAICTTTDPNSILYISTNNGAFVPLVQTGQSGVTSFKGRTGAVVPAQNDYTYAQLANKPVAITCTDVTADLIQVVGGKATLKNFSGTGCTLQ